MTGKNRRQFYRIFTDIPCLFAGEHKMYQRQVNISAGGIALAIMPEMDKKIQVGEYYPFSFEIKQQKFSFKSLMIRHEERNGKLPLIALQYQDISEETQKQLDNIILSLGGYHPEDLEKKLEYLAWYAPKTLEWEEAPLK
jgi:c-di-GMP-binding flagellar brake protein YcgR